MDKLNFWGGGLFQPGLRTSARNDVGRPNIELQKFSARPQKTGQPKMA
jgi:hypothetical protein